VLSGQTTSALTLIKPVDRVTGSTSRRLRTCTMTQVMVGRFASRFNSTGNGPHPELLMRPQLLRYLVIGSLTAAIDFGLTWLLLLTGFWPAVAVSVAYPVSILFHFFANKKWTFGSVTPTTRRELLHYFAVVLTCYFIFIAVVEVGTKIFLWHTLFCKLVATPLVIVVGFLGIRMGFSPGEKH